MRAAVVGHLEWVQFVSVEEVPRPGEIVHALYAWEEPGGGGAGAAVQLQKLTGDATFFTALGDDDIGTASLDLLARTGLHVEAARRPERTRRAVTFVDARGERTITVLGARLSTSLADRLDWLRLRGADAVYFTAGDVDTLRAARAARVLVATTRALPVLADAGVYLDAVVGSALDEGEAYSPGDVDPEPALMVLTEGDAGGTYRVSGARPVRYEAASPRGPVADRYGAGDSFAAGLAFALARGDAPDAAVRFAARCGAAVVAGRGPYESQLTAADLGPLDDGPR